MSTLEDIKARAEKAIPGPWEVDEDPLSAGDWMIRELHPEIDAPDDVAAGISHKSTAESIAHARTDVLKLVAALESGLRAVEAMVEHFREGLAPENPDSWQHRANSNRAFGADSALEVLRAAINEALT